MLNFSTKELSCKLNLRSLSFRRKLKDVALIYKILNGKIICSENLKKKKLVGSHFLH
jgi:hypothetical protein